MSKKTFERAAERSLRLIAQVKANQPTLFGDVQRLCDEREPLDRHETIDAARARPNFLDGSTKCENFGHPAGQPRQDPQPIIRIGFRQIQSVAEQYALIVPRINSERRQYLPVGLLPQRSIVSDQAYALYDAPLWNMALIASRLHLVWIATVCGKLKTDFRYSNTLGWNAFPVPTLTEKNRADLTACAENILLTL